MMRRPSLLLTLCLLLGACVSEPGDWPMKDGASRATPLHFGLYVTPDPESNPIDPPERFTGYHVGTDFEIREGEENAEIPILAICSGKIVYSGYSEGYGGLLVQRCKLDGEDVTVLYGHIMIAGLPTEGTKLSKGQRISVLAPARSYESGGNRKHLHLGIHRGKNLDLRGYVQSEEEIDQFVDALTVLP